MNGLSVRGLTVRRGERLVLHDISFSAEPGQITALLGRAGAGKTTLLAAIAGLLPCLRGGVFFGGQDLTGLKPGKRRLGLLLPGTVLTASATVEAELRRLAKRHGRRDLADLITALGLQSLAGSKVGELGHGEGLRALAAARLLAGENCLLLDEAGSGLDLADRRALLTWLRARAPEAVIVLATRDATLAQAADHLVLLRDGKILDASTPASLYAEPRDRAAAELTGPANFLSGALRELRPGGFIWSAAGTRFKQTIHPETARPALGADIALCLRPERFFQVRAGETPDNSVEAHVIAWRAAGPLVEVALTTALGPLIWTPPSWPPGAIPRPGHAVKLGWAADAPTILPPAD